MMKKGILKIGRKPAVALLIACIHLLSFTYTGGVYALQGSGSAAPESADYWDGTDSFTSLDAVLSALGAPDDEGYYHIATAVQLHAVIRYNGGGYSYRLDNDLCLNTNYLDYASWGTAAPTNTWDFTGHSNKTPTYQFYGTVDGCGHTVYGLYSGSGYYAGLFGGLKGNADTVIKNLEIRASYIRASMIGGVVAGGSWWSTGSEGHVTLTGVSVRDAVVNNVWNNGSTGGLVGVMCQNLTVDGCSVTGVAFTSGANETDVNGVGSIGAFVGAPYSNTSDDYATFVPNQARCATIRNSFAVNNTVTDKAGKVTKPYIAGIYRESDTKWAFSANADRVYTDSTDISQSLDGSVKLLVSTDGQTAVDPASPDYPVKTVTAEAITGEGAKTVMPDLDWDVWQVVEGDYPYYSDRFTGTIWSGSDSYATLDELLAELGEPDSEGYYHITTAEQLHGAVKFNGGGLSYRIDNDLYLNKNYENYASWGDHPPANVWDFTGHTNMGGTDKTPNHQFTGTIDGCGHTVYGLYSGSGYYAGLLGGLKGNVTVKNLNVWYSYIRASMISGVVAGGNWHATGEDGKIDFSRVSVRYAVVKNVWNNGSAGGIIGLSYLPLTVDNCAVADVTFNSVANETDPNGPSSIGAFVGAGMSGLIVPGEFSSWQAGRVKITDSYSVNTPVTDKSGRQTEAYICGLYWQNGTWFYCVTADHVYTDSTDISRSLDGTVQLQVSSNGSSAVSPGASDYPVVQITPAAIRGAAAKTAMPALDWCTWSTVSGDYPTPQGGHSLIAHPAVPATCTTEGTGAYWICEECGRMFADADGQQEIDAVVTVEPLNHKNASHYSPTDATCDEDGNLEYWYCPDCGRYATDSGFTALCERDAVILPATHHRLGRLHYPAAEATCEEDGHIDYWYCADCGRYFTDENCTEETSADAVITDPATGHSEPIFHPATPAGDSCLEPGTVDYWECPACGQAFADEDCTQKLSSVAAPSEHHRPQRVERRDATCYETGLDAHWECTVCHHLFNDEACREETTLAALTLPATNHSAAVFQPELLPGCTTVGVSAHWYCADCGHYFTDADLAPEDRVEYSALLIPAAGHQVTDDTPFGYNGENHWKSCEVCGLPQYTAPHKLSDPVTVDDGTERYCDCGYGIKAFRYDAHGVYVNTGYGVFAPDVKITVEYLQTGSDRDSAVRAISDAPDAAEVYRVSASSGQLFIPPNGKVEVVLPVLRSYSGNVAVYFIDSDGFAAPVAAQIDRTNATATLSVDTLGTFVVADLGVTFSGTSAAVSGSDSNAADQTTSPQTGGQDAIMIFLSAALAAGFIIVLSSTRICETSGRKNGADS